MILFLFSIINGLNLIWWLLDSIFWVGISNLLKFESISGKNKSVVAPDKMFKFLNEFWAV